MAAGKPGDNRLEDKVDVLRDHGDPYVDGVLVARRRHVRRDLAEELDVGHIQRTDPGEQQAALGGGGPGHLLGLLAGILIAVELDRPGERRRVSGILHLGAKHRHAAVVNGQNAGAKQQQADHRYIDGDRATLVPP